MNETQSRSVRTDCMADFKAWWSDNGIAFKARGVNEEYAWAVFRSGWHAHHAAPSETVPTNKITSVTRAFDFDKGKHTPWVMVCFPENDWAARDAFAKSIGYKEEAPGVLDHVNMGSLGK